MNDPQIQMRLQDVRSTRVRVCYALIKCTTIFWLDDLELFQGTMNI